MAPRGIRAQADRGGDHGETDGGQLTRRGFLAGAATIGVLAWTPAFRIAPASAQATCAPPPAFPASIPLYQQAYRNWSGEIVVDALWTCVPASPADVVAIANWARVNGWRLRPRGSSHNWSPLTITPGSRCDSRILLVDTTQHLTAISISSSPGPARVTVQTGATMEALLTRLEQSGYGLAAVPAPGDLTVGGVLAIDAHGTAIPARGEVRVPGHTYGSLSNLVTSLTAVVWDPGSDRYVLRTFGRAAPQTKFLLTHLGRAFLTEVTLQVGINQRLRCQSWVHIPAREMFGAPGSGAGRTFASSLESSGRVEALWFPFTSNPWLKAWSVRPTRPFFSRQVNRPYNYPFSDNLPVQISGLASRILSGEGSLTPQFCQTQYDLVAAGLVTTASWDLWGWSKNVLLYVRPTTLRVTANGYAILTRRGDVQRVVHEFTTHYSERLAAYRAQGRYPMNGPVEIRVTGLDRPADVEVPSSGPPVLSAVRPRPDRPEWDVAVWIDLLTLPGTPGANEFYREFEQWVFTNYAGSYAAVRPEWSKGWAYTDATAWADPITLSIRVPDAYRAGQVAGDDWDAAVAAFREFDPDRIFSNAFLDTLLP